VRVFETNGELRADNLDPKSLKASALKGRPDIPLEHSFRTLKLFPNGEECISFHSNLWKNVHFNIILCIEFNNIWKKLMPCPTKHFCGM
jgi:hypothetical protein